MVDKSHILSIKVTVLYWTRFIKNTYSILKCGFFWYNKTQIKLFQLKKPYVDWLKLAAVEMAVKIGQNGHCALYTLGHNLKIEVIDIKMLGVQSCKHFGCQRSHPMILGFGHPSGAMEDGARGKILVFKQWKWTDYYIMWSLCIVESTVLARQTKKLSKFEVRN